MEDDAARYGVLATYQCRPGQVNAFIGGAKDYLNSTFANSGGTTWETSGCLMATILMPPGSGGWGMSGANPMGTPGQPGVMGMPGTDPVGAQMPGGLGMPGANTFGAFGQLGGVGLPGSDLQTPSAPPIEGVAVPQAMIMQPQPPGPEDSCMIWMQFADMQSYVKHQNNPVTQNFTQRAAAYLAAPPTVTTGITYHWQSKDGMGPKFGLIAKFNVQPSMYDEFEELYEEHFDRQLDGKTEPNATVANCLIVKAEPVDTVYFMEQWEREPDYRMHQSNPNTQQFLRRAQQFTRGPPEVTEGSMEYWQVGGLKAMDGNVADDCCCSVM